MCFTSKFILFFFILFCLVDLTFEVNVGIFVSV